MTEKLYYKNSYIKEFSATVRDCIEYNGKYAVILDKTAFFPCGGGQYGDTGVINGINITDTIEKDGEILHIADSIIDKGTVVLCNIDWEKRFMRMQNHSGEHILSGLIFSQFGYNNVGFHLGDDDVTLDCDGKLSDNDIELLESKANKAIDENLSITAYFPTKDELSGLQYRSKLDLTEDVRIVVIDKIDKCACCAPHVASTSQIGLIKVSKHYNYKNGTRIHIKCGELARRDYSVLQRQANKIANDSSVKPYEIIDTYDKLKSEISLLKNIVRNLRDREIQSLIDNPDCNNEIYFYSVDSYSNTEIVSLLNQSLKKHQKTAVIFSYAEADFHSFIIGGEKAKECFEILKTLGAKGGGKDYIQGRIQTSDIGKVIETIKERA